MLNLEQLQEILCREGANEVIFKCLSENDNAKNQIYFGGSYDALQLLPYGKVMETQGTKRLTYKAPLDFWWLSDDGRIVPAPNAQIILYPKYPEIRFSGFLSGCSNAPSDYMQPLDKEQRRGIHDGRILVLAPISSRIIGYLAPPNSPVAKELSLRKIEEGIFGHLVFSKQDARKALIEVLKEAYTTNPHELVRMFSDGSVHPYSKSNAPGYTLEAMYGIIPNGQPDPDFKGWELKCHKDSTITLMTPQPDGGLYYEMGNRDFVLKYGHVTSDGGMYFTGPYFCSGNPKYPNRRLVIRGFDPDTEKITSSNGAICLLQDDIVLASWSFPHVLSHWNNKHNKACYVRYKKLNLKDINEINFLPVVSLCENTSAIRLLHAVLFSKVYFDPGSRVSSDGSSKARSQFRVKSQDLSSLYAHSEMLDLSL